MVRPRSPSPVPGRINAGWGVLLIAVLTVLAYLPALRAGFVWDDDHFLTHNPLIRASDGLYRFWCTTQPSDYWPVTSTTLWLEWRWWGMHAAGYHATNLALHLGSVFLLWAILRRLLVPAAFLAALVFALHPVNVESVAWITQRKNLMAMIFVLTSIYGYLEAERGGPKQGRLGAWYALSLAAFILAMLSKGSVAPLPLVLLGLVAWVRPLVRGDWARLLPYFAVSAALTGVDIWFQRHGTAEIIREAGALERLLGAGAVAWFYLAKALLPLRQTFCYPQWELRPDTLAGWLPLLAGVAVAAALWAARGPRLRPVAAGLGIFLVMLLPVLGLTDVYFMKYSLVADHYQHVAIVGVIGLAALGWGRWRDRAGGGAVWPVLAACAAVGTCGWLTWRQCHNYRDRQTLFRSILKVNPGCWMAQNNLGLDLIGEGKYAEALGHCRETVRLRPGFAEGHNNLGIALAALGSLPGSIVQFRLALELRPNYPEAWNNLGNVHRLQKDLPMAIDAYADALRLRPGYAEAHNNLGVALMDLRRLPEAIAHLREAVALAPDYEVAKRNLALALRLSGRKSPVNAGMR